MRELDGAPMFAPRHGGHAGAILLAVSLSSCLAATSPAPSSRRTPQSYPQESPRSSSSRGYDANEAERLRRVMVPLIQGMNRPCRVEQVRVGIIRQNDINAANAGNCQFYVTTGLLARATDDQLRGVLAHELAHEDLGHVASAQVRGAGLNILAAGLQQLFPAAGAVAPIAGELVARNYSRADEYAADKHGVDILRRAGYSKEVLLDSLSWIRRQSGGAGGGFLSTHPGLDERIGAIQRMR